MRKILKAFLCRFLGYFRPILGHFKPLVSLANNEDGLIHIESQSTGSHFFLVVYTELRGCNARITKHYSAFKTLSDGNPLLLWGGALEAGGLGGHLSSSSGTLLPRPSGQRAGLRAPLRAPGSTPAPARWFSVSTGRGAFLGSPPFKVQDSSAAEMANT